MHIIKEVNKAINNNKNLQQEIKELIYILKAKTETVINSIIITGIETPLNTAQDSSYRS